MDKDQVAKAAQLPALRQEVEQLKKELQAL